VDAKARRFTISQENTIAPGFNKEERELSLFFMYKARKVPCLIEQGDGKERSQEGIEEDGALGGHGLRASPGGQS
jgi:hypothetical protein